MASEAVLTRFLRERQILARLSHPNILQWLPGGLWADACPYRAMECPRGGGAIGGIL